MKRSFTYIILVAIILATGFSSCQKVPITGRKQVHLLPNSTVRQMAFESYATFIRENPPLPPANTNVVEVQQIGNRIKGAVETYMKNNGLSKRLNGYSWEFNVVQSPEVNAFCIPGGKVVVYSGILPVTKDDDGLAVVMGHEIAHAIADHGNERLSQQLAVQLGGVSLAVALQKQPELTQQVANTAFGIGSTLGILAYSRQHELEADKLGLIFMAMAGYNPERALSFWTDMSKSGSGAPPEFLSTHPSDARRIKQLTEFMPEAKKYYNPANKNITPDGGKTGGNTTPPKGVKVVKKK